MKVFNHSKWRGIWLILLVFLTVSTVSCGKSEAVKHYQADHQESSVEQFAEAFFYDCNLPYQKLQESDVQHTADEYLFYISGGVVYRTLNDSAVVIVRRSDIRESEERIGTDYSGELYPIFEDDAVDLLKYAACGDYALMANASAIPNWEESEIITSFMDYAIQYPQSIQ